jgi:hypothetical protein
MHGNSTLSLYNYPYLKLAKTPCFSYYLFCFFFNKIREQEGGTGSAHRWREEANNVYTYKKCKKIKILNLLVCYIMKKTKCKVTNSCYSKIRF